MDIGFSELENTRVKPKRYTIEFKKEAVRYIILEGQRVQEVADRLGLNPALLYRWKSQFLEEMGGNVQSKEPSQLSPKELAQEIESLRKQLHRSERINEILKKTVSYFAKDEQ